MRYIIMVLTLVGAFITRAQTLEEYIEMAVQHHPGLKAKEAEYQAYLQKIPQARSIPDLEVTADVVTRHMVYPEGNQLFGLTAMQMFPWFGKLEAMEVAAEKNATAFRKEWDNYRNEVVYRLRVAWYPWKELYALIQNKQQNLLLLNQDKELAAIRYQQGLTMLAEVIMSDVMIAEEQTDLSLLEAKAPAIWADFAQGLGVQMPMPPLSPEPLMALPLPEGLTVSNNPQLTIYDQKILAAEAEAQAIKKDQLPMIGAGVRYLPLFKREEQEFHLEPNAGAQMIMPMIAVSIPLFGKKYEAGQKEMSCMQTAYREMKQSMLNQLNGEMAMANFELEEAGRMQILYAQQLEKLQEATQLMLSAYQNGDGELRDILQLRKQMFALQEAQIKSITAHNQAIAKILYLTGSN